MATNRGRSQEEFAGGWEHNKPAFSFNLIYHCTLSHNAHASQQVMLSFVLFFATLSVKKRTHQTESPSPLMHHKTLPGAVFWQPQQREWLKSKNRVFFQPKCWQAFCNCHLASDILGNSLIIKVSVGVLTVCQFWGAPKQHPNSLDEAQVPQVGWASGTGEQLSCLMQCYQIEKSPTES